IESAINESAYISQSLVVGDNQKYIIALVNPEYESLIPWAEKQGIKFETKEELSKKPEVKELIDRKSTRLNSSHVSISYAVFCLKYTTTSQIYNLSLHDALPIYRKCNK